MPVLAKPQVSVDCSFCIPPCGYARAHSGIQLPRVVPAFSHFGLLLTRHVACSPSSLYGWACLNEIQDGFSLTHSSSFALWSSAYVSSEGEEWNHLAYTMITPRATLPLLQWSFPAESLQADVHTTAEIFVGVKPPNVDKTLCMVSEIQRTIN